MRQCASRCGARSPLLDSCLGPLRAQRPTSKCAPYTIRAPLAGVPSLPVLRGVPKPRTFTWSGAVCEVGLG